MSDELVIKTDAVNAARRELMDADIALQKAKVRQMKARCTYDIASQNLRLQRDLLELSRRVEG